MNKLEDQIPPQREFVVRDWLAIRYTTQFSPTTTTTTTWAFLGPATSPQAKNAGNYKDSWAFIWYVDPCHLHALRGQHCVLLRIRFHRVHAGASRQGGGGDAGYREFDMFSYWHVVTSYICWLSCERNVLKKKMGLKISWIAGSFLQVDCQWPKTSGYPNMPGKVSKARRQHLDHFISQKRALKSQGCGKSGVKLWLLSWSAFMHDRNLCSHMSPY